MWLRKKVVIIPVLVALVVVGSIAGVALAQDDSESTGNTLLGKVAAILGIDQTTVEEAFAQAQQEMRDEALTSYLDEMVEQGKISQEEADQYKSWWDTKPDSYYKLGPRFGFGGRIRAFGHGGCGLWLGPPEVTPSTDTAQ